VKRAALYAAFLLLAAPAFGQGMDFQQLLSGKDIPFSLKLKDLNADWRRVGIRAQDGAQGGMSDMLSQLMQIGMMSEMGKGQKKDDAAAAMLGMSVLGGLFGGGGKEPVCYTKGQTVTVSGETFLVTYRYQKPEINWLQMAMESQQSGKEPDFARLTAGGRMTSDSVLTINLVNVRAIGSLSGIRVFDTEKEIAESGAGGGLLDLMALGGGKMESAPTAPVAEEKAVAESAGESLAMRIQLALITDGKLSRAGSTIVVTAQDKTLVLTGRVDNANLKARATNLTQKMVKETGGGYTVVNKLNVGTGSRK
jgi:hypothetical protein